MPYGLPNETEEMTKWVEECVNSIKGINKRTDKPYTEGEKIAICKAQLKKMDYKISEKMKTWDKRRISQFRENVQKLAAIAAIELKDDESLRSLEDKIYRGLEEERLFPQVDNLGPWLVDTYKDFVIIEQYGKCWKVPYIVIDNEIKFDFDSKVQVVRVTRYEEATWKEVKKGYRKVYN